MADSLEDMAANFFAKCIAICLVVSGICWLVKWFVRKIVENAGPIIMVVAGIAALALIGVIFNAIANKKKAVAQWEQRELAPLLASLNAMNKLSQAESLSRRLPGELQNAENLVPQLERKARDAKSRGDGLDLRFL